MELLKAPIIVDREKTIDKILHDRASIARFGDGEIMIMLNKCGIDFQKIEGDISKRLREVLVSQEDNLLIEIPTYYFDDLDIYVDKAKKFFQHIRIEDMTVLYCYIFFYLIGKFSDFPIR